MHRLIGHQFCLEEIQKAVRAMNSTNATHADCINYCGSPESGDRMAEMLLKINNALWHQAKNYPLIGA